MAAKELARLQFDRVSFGIDRMRKSAVKIIPGHDGFYGVISCSGKKRESRRAPANSAFFRG